MLMASPKDLVAALPSTCIVSTDHEGPSLRKNAMRLTPQTYSEGIISSLHGIITR